MAHFAKIDFQTNIVLEVHVVNNDDILNLPFSASEPVGIAFLIPWNTPNTYWKQTSYNGNFRKNYAGIGYTYDATNDVFYAPQTFPSWILNNITWIWEAPVAIPTDGKDYKWNESITNWTEVTL
jgi:hypothetical protein